MMPFSGAATGACAYELQDLAGRLVNRVQLTMDGHKTYPVAVEKPLEARSTTLKEAAEPCSGHGSL